MQKMKRNIILIYILFLLLLVLWITLCLFADKMQKNYLWIMAFASFIAWLLTIALYTDSILPIFGLFGLKKYLNNFQVRLIKLKENDDDVLTEETIKRNPFFVKIEANGIEFKYKGNSSFIEYKNIQSYELKLMGYITNKKYFGLIVTLKNNKTDYFFITPDMLHLLLKYNQSIQNIELLDLNIEKFLSDKNSKKTFRYPFKEGRFKLVLFIILLFIYIGIGILLELFSNVDGSTIAIVLVCVSYYALIMGNKKGGKLVIDNTKILVKNYTISQYLYYDELIGIGIDKENRTIYFMGVVNQLKFYFDPSCIDEIKKYFNGEIVYKK